MPKEKKAKNITSDSQETKVKSNVFEMSRDMLTWKMLPVSDAYLEQLGKTILSASNDEKTLSLNELLDDIGVLKSNVTRWRKRSEHLDQICDLAVRKFQYKRERLALERKHDPKVALSLLPFYAPDYRNFVREEKEHYVKIKAESPQATVLQVYDCANTLPEKKDDVVDEE